MLRRSTTIRTAVLAAALLIGTGLATAGGAEDWVTRTRPSATTSEPPPRATAKDEAVAFVLDGEGYDGDFGFFRDGDLNTPAQALYLNRFTPDRFPLILDEIQIFFTCNQFDGTSDDGDCDGKTIDLVVIEDTDGDTSPQTGGRAVTVRQDVVKTIDKENFSIYTLDPPVRLDGPGDIFVGYIPRWIDEGVTGFTVPTTMEAVVPHPSRSWGVAWTTDPPDPPTFPADHSAVTTDDAGFSRTFKIRAAGVYDDAGDCTPSETVLCLGTSRRFEAQVAWTTGAGSGAGTAVSLEPLGLDDGGVFWFFDPKNPELLVKVLDGCGQAIPRFWVFFAATTDVGFELTVTDTLADETAVYTNPAGQRADAVTDTDAFATCDALGGTARFGWDEDE